MTSDSRSLVEHVRRIPMEAILSYHGLTPRREGATTRYKDDRVNIVVGGNSLWFDNAASVGGRGSIDLILHLKYGARPRSASKRDFQDAVQWLATFEPGAGLVAPVQSVLPLTSKRKESFESQTQRLALRDDARWPMVRSYLIGVRQLPTHLVDTLRQRGDIYASFSLDYPARTGACFVHRNLVGEARGATIRPADGGAGVSFSIGEKQGAWFTLGDLADASRLVVTEAPIDALSYIALTNPADTVVMAMSGSHVFQPVLRAAHERGWELAVGFDNDRAGNAGWERCQENYGILYPNDLRPCRIIPAGKDWNDDLRLAPRRSQGRHL
jgi:hypothetical protein